MRTEAFALEGPGGALSAESIEPDDARALLLLAHGAGAGFRHATMLAISNALAAQNIATVRFNFPFMEAGRRRVDPRPTAVAALAAALAAAQTRRPDLALFLGGHSFGGRMATHAAAEGAVATRGVVCLSFPLHPANRPGRERAAHLPQVAAPLLFLSGTRDALADRRLLQEVVTQLGSAAELHWLDDADHGYRVRKRERREPRGVFDEIAGRVADFVARH